MSSLEQVRVVSRATETTRAALIKAATSVFAEFGYDGGSVRLITKRAMANQAAVNYHFGGKDGLYREVLIAATRAFEENAFLDAEELDALSPEDALRRYLRQFLLPLVKRDRVSRYLRIFAWESVQPSQVFSAFIAQSPPRIFRLADRVVRRFLPQDASAETITFAMLWLAQQPMFFVREAERLGQPPFSLTFDDDSLERLVDTLACLSLQGLAGV
ncbi:MAG: TetR/AcrR family transcriptional regulator [Alphaproteobacteria bacterium]|nr:TetR/AcrR family transcriptional regulator [Alphaproteobacteria bacterium]MBM3624419.1 TetR/AcrR family transcriptional regulator [Alphaproteobacteria bacterium]